VYAETAGGISAGPGVGPVPPGARLGGEYTIRSGLADGMSSGFTGIGR
jgi:hypothetical protein